ncbi:MAG: plastocyanin/azurin family copper-binding protein [Gemmatimonadaceae bacterium]
MSVIRVVSFRVGLLAAAALFLMPALFSLRAQSAAHLVVIKMVEKPGGHFAFEPAAFSVQRGDTVRFVQSSTAPHNVHFKQTPKGAKLGTDATGSYVIGDGATYNLVVDARFIDGTYEFICDPHESVGMKGTMTVGTSAK